MAENPTRQEVAALLVSWKVLEKRRAAALLRSERSALSSLTAVAREHVHAAADRLDGLSHAPGTARLVGLRAIQQTSATLRDGLTQAITDTRSDARQVSQERTAAEFQHLRKLLRKDGWGEDELPPDPSPADADHDAIAAANAAASLASRWGILALGALRSWEDNPASSLQQAIRSTVSSAPGAVSLLPAVSRTAATETATAFNEEHLDALEPLSDYDWAPGLFKVWSALLDGRVCQRCFENDGEAVPVNAAFRSGDDIPLHPYCRCIPVPLYIPRPRSLEDVAIDYAGYKAEIRDLIREGRAKPVDDEGRHAASFIARSRFPRSPIVISKDFTSGRLSRPRR